MKFRTEILPVKSEPSICYDSTLFFLGSCFSDEIGGELARAKFSVCTNPFGVLYNPASVYDALDILINEKVFTKEDLYRMPNAYLSFYHDTSFTRSGAKDILELINNSVSRASIMLRKADYIFITFGTARIYRLKETGRVVSNCHKLPSSMFVRELLSPEFIADKWERLIDRLREINSKAEIVFTVSPVRHWKDGAHGNQVSKSVLFLAVEKILSSKKHTSYFPSYELLTDDLRDYRYYADDLIHPGTLAVEYILDFFKHTYMEESTLALNKEVMSVVRGREHRPMGRIGEENRIFADVMLRKLSSLAERNPALDFTEERQYFRKLAGSKD